MNKKLIEYIVEMESVNYADVQDFIKDIQHNPTVNQVSILANVLLYIEHQERLNR